VNFGEMKSEVYRRLNESSSSPIFWADSDIEQALNEGYEEMADATEWYERFATLDLLSGKTYFDLRSVLSDTILAPKRIRNNQTEKWLTPTDPRELDYHTFVQWEKNTGEPQMFFTRGLWWLGFYPKQNADSGSVRLYYSSIPPAMSADEDEPAFPEEFHYGPVAYAVYDLLCQDRETQKGLIWWKEYVLTEEAFRRYVIGRISLDRVEGHRA
jgi:hypothetical protein